MMHQYIGARYVPYYYENSLDPTSTLWESNVTYEPLTVVTLPNMHSYISKKTVPDTVGSPADNAEYWLDTGSDNAYIQELQDQVDNIKSALAPIFNDNTAYNAGDFVWYEGILYMFDVNHSVGAWDPSEVSLADFGSYISSIVSLTSRMDTAEATLNLMTHRRYIIIADSYGTFVNGVTPFVDTLKTLLNASNDDYYNFSEGSMGFSHAGNGGHTAYTLLLANEANVTDPDTITDIVITVGLNDIDQTASDIRSGINSIYSYIRTHYPNATIWYGYVGNKIGKTNTEMTGYFTSMWVCNESMYSRDKVKVMAGIEYIMHILKWIQADMVHPNATGSTQIAVYLNDFLQGGNPVFRYDEDIMITGALAGNTLKMHIEGGTAHFSIARANVASAISVPDRNYVVGGALSNPPVKFENLYPMYCATAWYTSANTYEIGSIGFAMGNVYAEVANGAAGKTILANAAPMYIQGNSSIDTLLL